MAGLLYAANLTHGTFQLHRPEVFEKVQMEVLAHLKVGRFDLEHGTIGSEAFVRDGKYYDYRGPFPAFLRQVLLWVDTADNWSRISCLIAACLCAWSALSLLREALERAAGSTRAKLFSFWTIGTSLVLAGPLMLVTSIGYIYHESILWGLAWNLLFFRACLQWSQSERPAWTLSWMAFCAGCALLSRLPFAFAPFALFGLLSSLALLQRFGRVPHAFHGSLPEAALSKRALVSAALVLLSLVAVQGAFNLGRWGKVTEFYPIRLHTFMGTPEGQRLLALPSMDLERVPTALSYYLEPRIENFRSQFPYVGFAGLDDLADASRRFHGIEAGRLALTLTAPLMALALMVALGRWLRGRSLALALCALACLPQALLVLTYQGLSLRIQADLMPLLLLAALAAVPAWLAFAERQEGLFRVARVALCVLLLGGFYATWIGALLMKADPRAAWVFASEDVQARVTRFLGPPQAQ